MTVFDFGSAGERAHMYGDSPDRGDMVVSESEVRSGRCDSLIYGKHMVGFGIADSSGCIKITGDGIWERRGDSLPGGVPVHWVLISKKGDKA